MRVTLLQTDIRWASPEANAIQVERLLAEVPPSDLYVLPEMWSTGFATKPVDIAETNGRSLAWMVQAARQTGGAFSGSIAVGEAGEGGLTYYNRHYFVQPDGTVAWYDKRHLFGYGGESEHYTAGTHRTVVTHAGWRWLLLTCYDLRFPVWSRYRNDYDGIIIVANWPESRRAVWDVLLRARAIENQCHVVAVNRVGDDASCHYNGGSMVVDAKGRVLATCPDGLPTSVTVDLDLDEQQRFRKKFAVLADRDTYCIQEPKHP